MFQLDKFFAEVRKDYGKLKPLQVDGFTAILEACKGSPIADASYALATAYHETAATMQPVREAFYLSEAWRKKNLRYYPEYGRGYVQLTWDYNYLKADTEAAAVGLIKKGDLIKNLDLAMRPDMAAFIMRKGMDEGWFTKKKFADYLPRSGPATFTQFKKARRIINGTDKDELVANYAGNFQDGLTLGSW